MHFLEAFSDIQEIKDMLHNQTYIVQCGYRLKEVWRNNSDTITSDIFYIPRAVTKSLEHPVAIL